MFEVFIEKQHAGAMMSRTPAATPDDQPMQAPAPTGYLVSIIPGAIEVSARLATADELRGLMKALTASMTILQETPDTEIESLSTRLKKANAA